MGILWFAALALVGWFLREKSQRRQHAVPGGHRPDIDLPHEQEWELWHNALSLCSKKTRVCLAELGIEYKSHPIDLVETGSYENIGRRYLAVHPGGILPLLVHDGHPIYESHEQIRYAAAHAPPSAASLVPADPALAAEMEKWIDRSSLVGDDPIAGMRESAGNAAPGLTVPLFAAMMEEIPYVRVLEGLLFHRMRQRPMMFLAFKRAGIRNLHKLGPAAKIIGQCRAAMHAHLDAFEAQLEKTGGPWLLGETFSNADVSWMVIFDRLREGDSIHVFVGDGKRPLATAWWERWQARPSYRLAILEHAHPTVTRGIERLKAAKAESPELRIALEGS